MVHCEVAIDRASDVNRLLKGEEVGGACGLCGEKKMHPGFW